MAGSRLEKIGTIFSRTTGLIQSKALQWEDRPLWYDIYKAFPPNEEPRIDRPAPNMHLKKIFYKEDKIRAIFHRNNKQIGAINLLNNESSSITKKFIGTYGQLESQYAGKASEEQIYKETIEMLNRSREIEPDELVVEAAEDVSLSTAFKQAERKLMDKNEINISVKDIFKD